MILKRTIDGCVGPLVLTRGVALIAIIGFLAVIIIMEIKNFMLKPSKEEGKTTRYLSFNHIKKEMVSLLQ